MFYSLIEKQAQEGFHSGRRDKWHSSERGQPGVRDASPGGDGVGRGSDREADSTKPGTAPKSRRSRLYPGPTADGWFGRLWKHHGA